MAAYQLLFLSGFVTLAMSGHTSSRSTRLCWILPDTLGDFRTVSLANVSPAPADLALLNEYGLRTFDRRAYVDSAGRRMLSEAYQFGSSEGAHAAYLYLHPQGAVGSPLAEYSDVSGHFGQTYAVLAAGVTVVARNNYVFLFRGYAPSNSAREAMLDRLPGLDPTDPPSGECCGYFVESSERILRGPVSLAKFAPRIPPATAGFNLGGRGRVARFETPSGVMTKIVFEYPSQAIADQRFRTFRTLRGARIKIANCKIALIFDAADAEQAEQLLADIGSDARPMSFDPIVDVADGPMTLDDAMASTFIAWMLGFLIAAFRFLTHRQQGIPDRTFALHLANP
jgi:hypothetical protein